MDRAQPTPCGCWEGWVGGGSGREGWRESLLPLKSKSNAPMPHETPAAGSGYVPRAALAPFFSGFWLTTAIRLPAPAPQPSSTGFGAHMQVQTCHQLCQILPFQISPVPNFPLPDTTEWWYGANP